MKDKIKELVGVLKSLGRIDLNPINPDLKHYIREYVKALDKDFYLSENRLNKCVLDLFQNDGLEFDNILNGIVLEDTQNWISYASQWQTNPSFNVDIAGGKVGNYTLNNITIFRFVPTIYDPTQDAFYSNFDGINLTNLITTRG